MRRGKGFEVPFAVMRQIGTSMEDQLVSGFTRVIRSGAYADGTALPGIRKLAVLFGVSEITVRNAVKRLCRDGLLAARPRVGLTVCAPGGRSWRGTVLGIKAGPPGMYYANVAEGALGDVLRQNGWLYSSLSALPDDGDVSGIRTMLRMGVALCVTYNASKRLTAFLRESGVRFVEIRPECPSPAALLSLSESSHRAYADMSRALRAAGVRSVLSVWQHPAAPTGVAEMKDAGLKVRSMRIPPIVKRHNAQEHVQRAGLIAFDRLLSSGGVAEDAVVCNDDYLAAGVLSAFDAHGIRLPEDCRFVTFANRGLGPVYRKELSRIECDPAREGAMFGQAIVEVLEKGAVRKPAEVELQFVRGDTIVHAVPKPIKKGRFR